MLAFVKVVIYWGEAKARFRSFLGAESGATSMEYALLASGLGIAILASVSFYADNVAVMFTGIATEVTE